MIVQDGRKLLKAAALKTSATTGTTPTYDVVANTGITNSNFYVCVENKDSATLTSASTTYNDISENILSNSIIQLNTLTISYADDLKLTINYPIDGTSTTYKDKVITAIDVLYKTGNTYTLFSRDAIDPIYIRSYTTVTLKSTIYF